MRWERAAQQLRREAELREWMRWNMIHPFAGLEFRAYREIDEVMEELVRANPNFV